MFWAAALLPKSIELLPFLPAVEYFWLDVIIWVLFALFEPAFLLKSRAVWWNFRSENLVPFLGAALYLY
jgi:hypothetical protein